MAIHNAKDNSFKLIFGNPQLFAEFLRDFLPIDLLKTVTKEDIEDLSERFLPLFQDARDSDTVKRVRLKGDPPFFIITILEHESTVNFHEGFKIFQYICMVLTEYEKDVRKLHSGLSHTKDFRYPPVLPVVFYDGPDSWTAEKNFADRTYMNDVFAKYIPKFEYELVDLNRYSLEDLTRFGDTLSVIMAIDKAPEKDRTLWLGDLFKNYVSNLKIPENLRKLLSDVITVLLSRLGMPEESINAAVDMIEKKEGSQMFERFVAGVMEEKEEFRRETWAQAEAVTRTETQAEDEKKAWQNKLESARKMKARGDSDEDIADILSLPVQDVAAL